MLVTVSITDTALPPLLVMYARAPSGVITGEGGDWRAAQGRHLIDNLDPCPSPVNDYRRISALCNVIREVGPGFAFPRLRARRQPRRAIAPSTG